MEDFSSQPQSIHGHPSTHPVAVAVLAIMVPILFALIAGVLYMVTRGSVPAPVATVEASPAPSQVLEKYEVLNATERLAVCNDGTPAAYYFRPGQEPNQAKWIVYQETGGNCTDDASCAKRLENEPHRVSSAEYPALMAQHGSLSSNPVENPDYWNYNHVYIKYCSSDDWLLDESRVINGTTVQFRGQRILPAVLEDLRVPETAEVIYLK